VREWYKILRTPAGLAWISGWSVSYYTRIDIVARRMRLGTSECLCYRTPHHHILFNEERTTMSGTVPIRVVFADDYPGIRKIIRTLLEADMGIEIVGEAASGTELLALCRASQPGVVLLDLHMPGPLTPKVVLMLRADLPDANILIVSEEDDDVYVRGMACLPICGYILKGDVPDHLRDAIHVVATGAPWYSPSLQSVIATL
jgi:CheY-like chemotaxis protein